MLILFCFYKNGMLPCHLPIKSPAKECLNIKETGKIICEKNRSLPKLYIYSGMPRKQTQLSHNGENQENQNPPILWVIM